MNYIHASAQVPRRRRAHLVPQRADADLPTRADMEWMDREGDFRGSLFPQAVRIEPDPRLRVMKRRRSDLGHRVAALRERGRVPRVCLYALGVSAQSAPALSLGAVRAFAVREGWHVGTNQIFTDHTGPIHPASRPGWIRVQRHVRSGYADGVVALTQSAVTPRWGEYETQLQWFADHLGFIALVHPEIPVEQR